MLKNVTRAITRYIKSKIFDIQQIFEFALVPCVRITTYNHVDSNDKNTWK